MHRHLISEWSAGEHSSQLAIVGHEADLVIALTAVNPSGSGTIEFSWDESGSVIKGITETLITKHGQLEVEMIVGVAVLRDASIVFGWSPYDEAECALTLSQGEERILIAEGYAVEFFRWLRRSIQLIGRIVS